MEWEGDQLKLRVKRKKERECVCVFRGDEQYNQTTIYVRI